MLRMESETGWWLITHPDHARLAGEFATAWGNAQFRKPEPRARVLKGICCHDDGWVARDAHPSITREASHRHSRRSSSVNIRRSRKRSTLRNISPCAIVLACALLRMKIAYARPASSRCTRYNLLTAHAESAPRLRRRGLKLLDAFLDRQGQYQGELKRKRSPRMLPWIPLQERSRRFWLHFRLFAGLRQSFVVGSCVAFFIAGESFASTAPE